MTQSLFGGVKKDGVRFSVEFFPPKKAEQEPKFWEAVDQLAAFKPDFLTVTHGASANGPIEEATDQTVRFASEVQQRTGIRTAAHLTCLRLTQDQLRATAEALWTQDVKHIVALRGDRPKHWTAADQPPGGFSSAVEIVKFLKTVNDFELSVSAYPEVHPEAESLADDLDVLKQKQAAGAARAITQFFFEPALFFDYVTEARAAGITLPLAAGLIPIYDIEKISRFAASCQSDIPQHVRDLFLDLSPDSLTGMSTALLIEQCRILVNNGVDHIHFYALNRADVIAAACQFLGVYR